MSKPSWIVRRVETCRRLITERKLIGGNLGYKLCPAPTWDSLLDLYLAHHQRRPVYLWSLCIAANIPMSSAHRKLAELVDCGLLERTADTSDGRRVSIALTAECRNRLDILFDQIADLQFRGQLVPSLQTATRTCSVEPDGTGTADDLP